MFYAVFYFLLRPGLGAFVLHLKVTMKNEAVLLAKPRGNIGQGSKLFMYKGNKL